MDLTSPFPAAGDGLFERVVYHLVLSHGLVHSGLRRDLAVGTLPEGEGVVVLRWTDPAPELAAVLSEPGVHGADVVLVGGDQRATAALVEALPAGTSSSTGFWHLPDEGPAVRVSGVRSTLGDRLRIPTAPLDWALFHQRAGAAAAAAVSEMESFRAAYQGRRVWVVRTLLVVLAAMYLLELATGAPDSTRVLLGLGALEPEAVRHGEPWRLLSYAFLHGNLLHIGSNAFVLHRLGGSLERVIGPTRFLIVYAVSALGGGLLVLAFGDGVTVGASGAIWGLMTAQFALVFRDRGLLPAPLRAQLRRGGTEMLLINGALSLLPGISLAGHLGGGLAGAALWWTGWLAPGLPRWVDGTRTPASTPPGIRAAAVATGVLLFGAPLVALLVRALGGR